MTIFKEYEDLLLRIPKLEKCSQSILDAYDLLCQCFRTDNFLFTCGNGGSASDADHIVGELLKGFVLKRPLSEDDKNRLKAMNSCDCQFLCDKLQMGFRAMSLMSQTAIYTAASNDLCGDAGPAQQLNALGRKDDVLLGISTSGNARNIEMACQVAKMRGMKIIGMTGAGGGHLAEFADVCIKVPEIMTFRVQELHLPIYHVLCIMLEKTFFKL